MAIQLSYDWIRKNQHKMKDQTIYDYLRKSNGLKLPTKVKDALMNCHWPGRCQMIRYNNIQLYIDGAHTHDSLQLCVDWFDSIIKLR